MKNSFLFLALVSLTLAAHAQVDIVKQRAKGVANGNLPPANSGPVVSAPPRPAPVATPANAQQHHVNKLKADLAAIHSAGVVSDSARRDFMADLLAVAQGHKPSTNSLATLANSLLPAVADRKVPAGLGDRMVQKLVVLMNSHSLSSTRTREIADEARLVLTGSGVSAEVATQIATDLEAVAAEVQKPDNL